MATVPVCDGCGHHVDLHSLAHFRFIDKEWEGQQRLHFQWLFICTGFTFPNPGEGIVKRRCECASFKLKEVEAKG